MSHTFEYLAEYAKSNRSSCRKCKASIGKDSLRLAKMVQSYAFDGKIPHWYHVKCFFNTKNLPSDILEIGGVDVIKFDDREKLKQLIGGSIHTTNNDVPSSNLTTQTKDVDDKPKFTFAIESIASMDNKKVKQCQSCDKDLQIGQVCITATPATKKTSKRKPQCFHLKCFLEHSIGSVVQSSTDVTNFNGFEELKKSAQRVVKEAFDKKSKCLSRSNTVVLKDADKENLKLTGNEQKMKAQSDLMWKVRGSLSKTDVKYSVVELLNHNKQYIPTGESKLLDSAVDLLCFGCLGPCPECNGKLKYSNSMYHCTGNISEWTRCQFVTNTVTRTKPIIPDSLMDQTFFKNFKFKKQDRVLLDISSVITRKQTEEFSLQGLRFGYIAGTLSQKPAQLRKTLKQFDCTLVSSCKDTSCFAVFTCKEKSRENKFDESLGIPLIDDSLVSCFDSIKCETDLQPYTISNGQHVKDRVIAAMNRTDTSESCKQSEKKGKKRKLHSTQSTISGSGATGFDGSIKTLSSKCGSVVDPEFEYCDTCHVVPDPVLHKPLSVTLGLVDVVRGSNSYYKMQLLKDDRDSEYYVFRSWGRVGTSIGGTKSEGFDDFDDAFYQFKSVYFDKTGNEWDSKKPFLKIPGKFFTLEIETDAAPPDEKRIKLEDDENGEPSKLDKSVQKLIKLIFDIAAMKFTMSEFQIDMNKLPLGKISKQQIERAYNILTELQKLLETDEPTKGQILDASNRFFTLIPHYFGVKDKIPILDNLSLVKNKTKMLTDLQEIEIAYSMVASSGNDGSESPVDASYRKLNCNISAVLSSSKDYELVQKYMQNTHGKTHSHFKLSIEQLYKVERRGEADNYETFKQNLENRMLLWHGSRVTNYAGILSQGLRIAPPEAPPTGYMFGKGIYFADMVSKSANYCQSGSSNGIGLLLLCEVALGNMYELKAARYIKKLPDGMHSTKGIGKTTPDPAGQVKLDDGVIVPMGGGIDSGVTSTALLYNEYIVYDVNQVNLKYLVMTRFET